MSTKWKTVVAVIVAVAAAFGVKVAIEDKPVDDQKQVCPTDCKCKKE